MSEALEAIQEAVRPLLAPGESLVAAALRKDSAAAVVLIHRAQPERWTVATYGAAGWEDDLRYGPDLASMQRACAKFIELASLFVREYPSFYQPPAPPPQDGQTS